MSFNNLPAEAFPIMKEMHLNMKKAQKLQEEFLIFGMKLSQFYNVDLTPELLEAIKNGVTDNGI